MSELDQAIQDFTAVASKLTEIAEVYDDAKARQERAHNRALEVEEDWHTDPTDWGKIKALRDALGRERVAISEMDKA